MENIKINYTLFNTAIFLKFDELSLLPSIVSFQFTNIRKFKFYRNYLTLDFHTNAVFGGMLALKLKKRQADPYGRKTEAEENKIK